MPNRSAGARAEAGSARSPSASDSRFIRELTRRTGPGLRVECRGSSISSRGLTFRLITGVRPITGTGIALSKGGETMDADVPRGLPDPEASEAEPGRGAVPAVPPVPSASSVPAQRAPGPRPAPSTGRAAREPNRRLAELITEAGCSNAGLARRVNLAGEAQGLDLRYDKTSVARWLRGQQPRGTAPALIAEALGRKL